MTPVSVAVIGNHTHHHCSEAVWARAFAKLGCVVTAMQVDGVARDPNAALSTLRCQTLVSYTRTHSPGMHLDPSWTDRWRSLEHGGTRTIGLHLDRFWDLERERLIGTDPQFSVGTCFTADGGNDARWQAVGVNHRWLLPGIDEDEALLGTAHPSYAHDIVFVGSGAETYHREYDGRRALLNHLVRVYGPRFVRYGYHGDRPGLRGLRLNDLYASAAVVVGDSCFANEHGSPRSTNYLSDRVPDVIGRGGFLLHPSVPGLRAEYAADELATYNPADWDDLDARIGEFLANPGEREGFVERGRARVLRDHTYTVRMREVLQMIGLLDLDEVEV